MVRRWLTALALVPVLSSCVAMATAGVVGVAVVQYQRNEAEQDFPNSLEESWEAALEGLKRLELEPEVTELGSTEGRIESEELRILLERHVEGFTRVRVRVGAFHSEDHERRARIVLQEISIALLRQDELRAWAEKARQRAQAVPPPKP
jgi:hypothetical protein